MTARRTGRLRGTRFQLVRPLAILFSLAVVLHFVAPSMLEAIVPEWLPDWLSSPRTLVYLSGASVWWVLPLWLRLPLQPLLIWWLWRTAVRPATTAARL